MSDNRERRHRNPCDFCRHQRQGCDADPRPGGTCSRCVNRGIPCTWTASTSTASQASPPRSYSSVSGAGRTGSRTTTRSSRDSIASMSLIGANSRSNGGYTTQMFTGIPTPDLSPHASYSGSLSSPTALYPHSRMFQHQGLTTHPVTAFGGWTGYAPPTPDSTLWPGSGFRHSSSPPTGASVPTTNTAASSLENIGRQIFLEFRRSNTLDWHADHRIEQFTDTYSRYDHGPSPGNPVPYNMNHWANIILSNTVNDIPELQLEALRACQDSSTFPTARLFCLAEIFRCRYGESGQYGDLMRTLQARHSLDISRYGGDMRRFSGLLDSYLRAFGLEPAPAFHSRGN